MITFRHPLLLAMPLLALGGCSMLEDPNYTYWQQSSGQQQARPVNDRVSARTAQGTTQARSTGAATTAAAHSGNDKATAPAANSTSVPVGRSAVVPVDSPAVPQTAPTAE